MLSLAIDDFLAYIRSEKGLSPHTIEAYGRDIKQFALFFQGASWKEATSETILRFLSYLKEQSYAPSTICRTLVAVKVFFRFLKNLGLS